MPLADNEETRTHESWGVLRIHRQQGNIGPLFGSSISHHNSIALTICRAESTRHLNQEWIHGRDELIEVVMSPVQWAEAITNMNCGSGTPVTICHVQGKQMPKCPDTNIRKQIESEFKSDMKEVSKRFSAASARIEELMQKKTALTISEKNEVLGGVSSIQRLLTDHLPFIHSQFNEAIQDTATQAKGEIEAFYTHAVMRAGEAALGIFNQSPEVKALEDPTAESVVP